VAPPGNKPRVTS